MDISTVPRLYFGPGHAFVIRAVKSLVTSEDDVWIEGIHGEHPEADIIANDAGVANPITIRRCLAGTATRDLNPLCTAICRFIKMTVFTNARKEVKRRVDEAQSGRSAAFVRLAGGEAKHLNPRLAGVNALEHPVVIGDVKRGGMG
jgi:hypothetical protein